MDLQQLRVFQQAARTGGFTRAGEELHLSQSTVSLHIKRLEEELGCPLFQRSKKRVQLNEAGRVLLGFADRILQELKSADAAVRQMNGVPRGTVRFGSGATTLTYMLPNILGAFQRKYPEVELIVTTDSTEKLTQGVHHGTLDLAVVMLPVSPSLPIEILRLLQEDLVYVVGSNHPLASRQELEPEDLRCAPFISFLQGSAMQALVGQHLKAMRVEPPAKMEMENIEAIKALIGAGLGAAVLPLCSVAGSHGSNMRSLRIKGFPMGRELGLALPTGHPSPAVQRLASRIARGLSGKTIPQIRAAAINAR